MRGELFSRIGWYATVLLVLFAPLIQGGAPRLPLAMVQCVICLVLLFWCVEWGWFAPCQTLRLSVADGLIGFFLFWSLFSLLFAPYHHSAEKALIFLFCNAALYWWLVFHPSMTEMDRVRGAVTAQGLLQSGIAWYQWLAGGQVRPPGSFYNPNFLAAFLVVALLLLLGGIAFPPAGGRRRAGLTALSLAAALLMGSALLLSGSRGGILALMAGLAVLLAGRSLRLSLAGIAGSLFALFVIPNPFTGRLADLTSLDVYAYSRIAIWKSSLKMALDHPWLGVGLGQFEYYSPRYAFPVDAHWSKFGRVAEVAHSEYLQAGAELGIPGLAVVVATVAVVVLAALRNTGKTSAARGTTVTLLAALTALLVHSAVDFPLHIAPLALLLVFLAAGLRICGGGGPSAIVEFRFRKVYAAGLMTVLVAVMFLALRPAVGFWYFLGGIGAPQDLLREKWALEKAPRKEVDAAISIGLMEKATAVDPRNATYHNALGSRLFQAYLRGEGDDGTRRRGLYHANYSSELNANSYRYAVNIGQALDSLYRISGDPALLQKSAEEYRRAVSLAPRLYTLHESLALIAEQLGESEEAEAAFREVVRLEPNYLRGWYSLGTFLARQGRLEEAEEALREGIRSREMNLARRVNSPYEAALVDFEGELFENRLREIEQSKTRQNTRDD